MRVATLIFLFAHSTLGSAQIILGTAASFGALSLVSITNTGPTAITGNIGTKGSSIIGFPPGSFTGAEFIGTAATTPFNDAQTAYDQVAALTGAIPLTGDLSGVSLAPGTYSISSSASLSTGSVLTLAGTGSSSDAWNFQIGTTLITGSGSSILLTNGGLACRVFWQVGSSATLGTGSTFVGTVLAAISVTADTTAVSSGGLFALGGSVTLDSNTIDIATCPVVSSSSSSAHSSTSSKPSSTTSSSKISSTTSTSKPSSTTSTFKSTSTSTSKPTSTSTSKSSTTTSSSRSSSSSSSSKSTSSSVHPSTTTTTSKTSSSSKTTTSSSTKSSSSSVSKTSSTSSSSQSSSSTSSKTSSSSSSSTSKSLSIITKTLSSTSTAATCACTTTVNHTVTVTAAATCTIF